MTTAEARTRKRYNAYLRRHGRCAVCTMRAAGSSPAHCKGWSERQGGCDTDGKLPVFRFDENVLKTAAIPAVYEAGGNILAKGDEITIDVDQLGIANAKGLRVYLVGQRAS